MKTIARAIFALVLASGAAARAQVPSPNPHYLTMGPVARYLMPDPAAEIALARTAAPSSVSALATVLALTKTGYVVGAKGSNGWVCLVGRSFQGGFDDPEFWNWRNRSPVCLNPPAVRSVLPQYLIRAKWAFVDGDTRPQMAKMAQAAYASHRFGDPAPGAFSFMLSKEAYLNDEVKGPWLPHVMLFIAKDQMNLWAAGFEGSPIFAPWPPNSMRAYEPTTIDIPVRRWSDGSLAPDR
ncbi:MAG TPA: hypothetical protein VMF61_01805 [Candidatus Acidoferrales bacterium]|nr:hypothetical protein [Candidatus Acidoferrales bacterium]